MPLIDQPTGGYRFLPGIEPYSCGVVALDGFEIVNVTFQQLPAYERGFERILQLLESLNRPRSALCSVSLRSPRPYSFQGFNDFNRRYASILKAWGIFVDGPGTLFQCGTLIGCRSGQNCKRVERVNHWDSTLVLW